MGERVNKIEAGDYILCMDNKCCWIMEHVYPKNKAPYIVRATGYFPRLELLFEDFIRRAKSKDTGSIEKTIKNIMDAEHDAEKMIREYLKKKKVR